jgi:cold shock CspA family protein
LTVRIFLNSTESKDGQMEVKYGTLVLWTERNYGFIREDESGIDVFTHVSGFVAKIAPPKGSRVKFEIGLRQGKPLALNIEPLMAPSTPVVGSAS